MSTCRFCDAPIEWVRTESGKHMCLDPDPHPNGNVIIAAVHSDGSRTVHVLTKAEMATERRQRRLAHKVTCGGKPRPPVTPLPPEQPMQDHLVLFDD